MSDKLKIHDKRTSTEKKLLQLMEIQLQIVEGLYADVIAQIKTQTTKTNEIKIIKNVPMLQMGINSSRQKVIVQMKASLKAFQKQLETKYEESK